MRRRFFAPELLKNLYPDLDGSHSDAQGRMFPSAAHL